MDQAINLVLQIDHLARIAIILGMLLCIGLHLVDLVFGEAAGRFDLDRHLLATAEILG